MAWVEGGVRVWGGLDWGVLDYEVARESLDYETARELEAQDYEAARMYETLDYEAA